MRYKLSDNKKTDPLSPPCKKTMYNTREEALDMINYIRENRVSKEIHAYKCNICGFWHLTSREK